MCLSSVFASLLLQSERLQFTVWLGPTSLGVFFFFFFFKLQLWLPDWVKYGSVNK